MEPLLGVCGWVEMVPILSLDWAAVFYEPMGIRLHKPQRLLEVARQVVRTNEHLLPLSFCPGQAKVRTDMLRVTTKQLGAAVGDQLEIWFHDVVRPSLLANQEVELERH